MLIETTRLSFNCAIDGPEDGPPLVFSNSLGASLRMWQPQVDALAREFRVVRYDQRGHGASGLPPGPYAFPALVDDVVALLDALELIDISNNIGDSRSLMCHPASTTHHSVGPEAREAMGVSEGLLRLNVGLEDPTDLALDLDGALRAVGL